MSISKNFVVRNGFEVSTDLILANATTRKVGIGTTVPQYTLHVSGGIGATDLYVSGIATVINQLRVGTSGTVFTVLGVGNSIGVGTALPAFLLDVRSPVSTGQTALYVYGDIQVTGDVRADDILITNLNVSGVSTFVGFATFSNNIFVTGIGTITTLNSTSGTITNLTGTSGTITTFNSTNGTITNLTGTAGTITTFNSTNGTIETFNSTNGTITNLNVTGISTLGTVKVSSGIITATSGIVTYFGDGNFLNLTSNPSRGIGIGTTGGVVGYAVTFINFKGSGVSTAQYNSSTGIATIFFEGGGGGGGSISISTTAPISPGSGDLWYSPDYGRTFIYYDESVVGYGTDAFWVDAAPFNVGIITSLSNVSFSPGSALAPSMFFIGDQQTGFFSPGSGQFTVVSSGSSVLNVNASGINITGIATITNASGTVTIGIGTTALLVEGNARVTGILTVGSSSITLNGASNIINVGTGLTLSSSGINVTGVITATSFVGNGSGLTGAGSTVADDTSTNATFYPVLTQTTSGTITASKVSTTKLTFNPSTGTVTATTFSGALTGTASNVTTNANLTGDVTSTGNATSIASGVIVNDDISASAGIVDTKLATIATASKVSNSATTATNANTASAIVARDASGNFSAGTITANLTGNVTGTATSTSSASFNGFGARTIQSGGTASGGSNGDIFYIY